MNLLNRIKLRIASILGYGNKPDRLADYLDIFIEVLVLVNVAAVIIESFDSLYLVYKFQFDTFEIFTVVLFGIEFLLRFWVADIRFQTTNLTIAYKKFFSSPNTWIDILAIAPFFLPYTMNIDLRHLRLLRLIRLMRVFKLTKYSHAMVLIGKIISEKRQELLATFLLMFSVLVLASSMMYYLEREVQPDAFPNILYAFWWGVVTLTTIGYGDVYPITAWGKVLGGAVALMGVMIVAIPTGIISSSFVQKMDESKNFKRMREIRKRLKEAFYKKYIPELACKVRRGQLSVDAVKVNLELSEGDIYKIAEGKNEFRFRYKKVISNGRLTDKLFLEYREINTDYGTLTDRKSRITLVSPESLNKQSIGYLVYCVSEKLKCNFLSNEFYGDEAEVTEESFGDKGLEPDSAFNFRHSKFFIEKSKDAPEDFEQWKNDLLAIQKKDSFYLVFNTFEQDTKHKSLMYMTYFKRKEIDSKKELYTLSDLNIPEKIKSSIENNMEEKFGHKPIIELNSNHFTIRENNILNYLSDELGSDCLLLTINEDFITNEKLFGFAAMLSDAIKETI